MGNRDGVGDSAGGAGGVGDGTGGAGGVGDGTGGAGGAGNDAGGAGDAGDGADDVGDGSDSTAGKSVVLIGTFGLGGLHLRGDIFPGDYKNSDNLYLYETIHI